MKPFPCIESTQMPFKYTYYYKIPKLWASTDSFLNYHIKASFTLLRFQIKTNIFQLVFTLVLKDAPDGLFLKARQARYVITSVFKLLRFWCSHYTYSFLFSSVFIQLRFRQLIRFAPLLGWINVNAKPKNRAKHIRFLAKTE